MSVNVYPLLTVTIQLEGFIREAPYCSRDCVFCEKEILKSGINLTKLHICSDQRLPIIGSINAELMKLKSDAKGTIGPKHKTTQNSEITISIPGKDRRAVLSAQKGILNNCVQTDRFLNESSLQTLAS